MSPLRGRSSVDLSTVLPPHDTSSEAWQQMAALMRERGWPSPDPTRHRVFATRTDAREVAGLLPDGPVVLDCTYVEIVGPTFVDELLSLRPGVSAENLNEDAADAWEYVVRRRAA